jgi:uncharacterized protein (TIGR02270 family)
MTTAIEDFKIALYREHLEEASALYDLRHALLVEPDREWRSLHDFEERLEAHLDALVIGGALALQVCAERMREGDAGELFASVCVCCRQKDRALFGTVWRDFDASDPEKARAVTEALRFEFPDEWAGAAEQAITRADPHRLSMLAALAAHRRLPLGTPLAARLNHDEAVASASVQALGFMPGAETAALLRKCLGSTEAGVRAAALRGLLLQGDEQSLRQCYLHAQAEDWPHVAMGLGGDRQAAAILRQEIEGGRATRNTIVALGLLGDLSTVRALTTVLSSEELGGVAADALHWITGAALYEDVFIPEPVDESELFEREREVWLETGEPPRRLDGRPFGSEVHRLSRDQAAWHQWLSGHAAEFDRDVRYRRGQPYSPRQLLDCLILPVAALEWRQLAYQELVIRYGCTAPFDAENYVVDQLARLRQIAGWVRDNEARFEASRGAFHLMAAR